MTQFAPNVEEGEVQIGDLSIAYLRRPASRKTILFLHGNSAGKRAFYKQFSGLADTDYTLIALDLPGHGGSSNSSRPEQDYNFPAFALLVKRFCDALSVEMPLVVGWSLGGHVVIEMAGRGFDLSGAMIFGTPPIATGLSDFETAFRPSEAMAVTLNPSPTEAQLNIYVQGLYGTLDPIPQTFREDAVRMDGAVRDHMGAHWASGEHGCHQRTVVAGWDKPICVIHGEDDVFVSTDYMDALTWRNLWGGQINKFAKVGHAPFVESPERFNIVLRDFADEVFRRRENAHSRKSEAS
jgi:pimeloyl-ACP methyl ester carboxylesterase